MLGRTLGVVGFPAFAAPARVVPPAAGLILGTLAALGVLRGMRLRKT